MCSWANEIKVFPYKDHHVTNCLPSSKNLGIEMQNSRYTGSDPRRAVRLEMLSIYHQTLTTGLTFSLCMLVVYFLEVFLLCKPMAFASWKVGERTGVTPQAWQLTREEDIWTGKECWRCGFPSSPQAGNPIRFCKFQQLPEQDLGMGFDKTHERGQEDRTLILEGHLGVSESVGKEWHFIFWTPLGKLGPSV